MKINLNKTKGFPPSNTIGTGYPTDNAYHIQQTASSYPQDDEYSIQCNDGGTVDLGIWYNHQFVANENLNEIPTEKENTSCYILDRSPILKGTTTGIIYIEGHAIQSFVVNYDDIITLNQINKDDDLENYVTIGKLNCITSELELIWNDKPEKHNVTVCYEYSLENPPAPKKNTFKKPTFENFLSPVQLDNIANNAGTIMTLDFATMLGDTIKEKYESIYVKCVELNNVLIKKGAAGHFWIVTSPEIASIFQTATTGYYPSPSMDNVNFVGGVFAQGGYSERTVRYEGAINALWRLYIDNGMDNETMLMGCNDEQEAYNHYGRIKLVNFII